MWWIISRFYLIGFIIVLMLSISIQSCKQESKKTEATVPKLVKTFTISQNQKGLTRLLPGKVHANEKADLSFQIAGTLIEFPIREGVLVKKNQLIARLDPRDFEINVEYAKAKYENANTMLSRYKKLLETKHVSPADYDQKKMEMETSKAALDKAKKALSDSYLYAPFEGLIAKQYVKNHQYIQAKTNIVSLQDNSNIEIQVDFSEQDLALTGGLGKLSDAVKTKKIVGYVTFPALSTNEYPVMLKEYATEANPKTQTFLFKLSLNTPQDISILPGMTAAVRFIKPSNVSSTIIPSSAVKIDANGNYYVWVINPKTMEAKKQNVKVGQIEGDTIQILEGLQDGEMIVTAGASQVVEGMKVRPST